MTIVTGSGRHAGGEITAFDYVVVGAGPAGVSAARELARASGGARIALIGEEASAPYERPPLSKESLRSHGVPPPQIFSVEEASALGVRFLPGVSVTGLNAGDRILSSTMGDVRYGSLLLATGASARRLPAPGKDLPGVHYLRTDVEAAALREGLAGSPRLVVVGGGFIGLEVAATASALGCPVDVVTMDSHLMNRCLPRGIAMRVADYLTAKGLRIHYNVTVDRIEGTSRVAGVLLSNGIELAADVVVVGVGSIPNVALAAEAGITTDDGIVVDHLWRTSQVHVFAAGDVARRIPAGAPIGARGVRIESWEPAIEQGRLAAIAMLGGIPDEPSPPWMWSDQFDLNIQITGNPDPSMPSIVRERLDGDGLAVTFLEGDRVAGAITLNDGPSMTLLRRAIHEGRRVEAAMLTDSETPLRRALEHRT